jgi:hypothetical protein
MDMAWQQKEMPGSAIFFLNMFLKNLQILRGHDRLVVGFTTIYAISTYHH